MRSQQENRRLQLADDRPGSLATQTSHENTQSRESAHEQSDARTSVLSRETRVVSARHPRSARALAYCVSTYNVLAAVPQRGSPALGLSRDLARRAARRPAQNTQPTHTYMRSRASFSATSATARLLRRQLRPGRPRARSQWTCTRTGRTRRWRQG